MEDSVYTGLLTFAFLMLVGIFVSIVLGCIIKFIWQSNVLLLTLVGEHRDRALRQRAFEGCSGRDTKVTSSRHGTTFATTDSLLALANDKEDVRAPPKNSKLSLISGDEAVFRHLTGISNDKLLMISTDGGPKNPPISPQLLLDLGVNSACATSPSKQVEEGTATIIQVDLSGPSAAIGKELGM
ncbi:hypothetical protein R1sor_027076 [Riccia sorocarpa]|uniref:Uncharacterized protein n=1 Tax=Riccia sorocarpa TaxID=122646 RepID=A0ABD3GD62_9MARC